MGSSTHDCGPNVGLMEAAMPRGRLRPDGSRLDGPRRRPDPVDPIRQLERRQPDACPRQLATSSRPPAAQPCGRPDPHRRPDEPTEPRRAGRNGVQLLLRRPARPLGLQRRRRRHRRVLPPLPRSLRLRLRRADRPRLPGRHRAGGLGAKDDLEPCRPDDGAGIVPRVVCLRMDFARHLGARRRGRARGRGPPTRALSRSNRTAHLLRRSGVRHRRQAARQAQGAAAPS